MTAKLTAGQITVALCAVGAVLLGLVVAPISAPGNAAAMIVPLAIAVFLGWQVTRMRPKGRPTPPLRDEGL